MKQYITIEQSKELSEKEMTKLLEWYKSKSYEQNTGSIESYRMSTRWIPRLSIGQMIEFLQDKDPSGFDLGIYYSNICDELWKRVKEKLQA